MTRAPTFVVTTGALLVSGDWACAHGNLEALSYVAEMLSERVGDPLRLELVELAQLCRRDEDLAADRWPPLRGRLASTS